MNYNNFFPKEAQKIVFLLMEKGFCAYFVGGCVRDYYMGRCADDYDITTDATSSEITEVLEGANIKTFLKGKRFGTVSARINDLEFEITPHRIEDDYADHRHPEKVSFVKELEKDLSRRDFTVNAMAIYEKDGKEYLYDPFDGKGDMQRKIIKCVGSPEKRFEEDALRILRAVRFSVQLGFEIEGKTAQAIKNKVSLLKYISAERKAQELRKIFANGIPERVLLGFPEVFSEILGNTPSDIAGFSKGGFCECLFFVLKDATFEATEKAVFSLKLSSLESEAILSYKKIYDMGVSEKSMAELVLKYGVFLKKYSEMFGKIDLIGEFFSDDTLPKSLKELNIGGLDLKNMGFCGVQISNALEKLFCAVLSGETENKKEALEEYAKEIRKDICK